jgi:SPP1 gp7 family putative phage head morphogenesis protein
MSHINLGLFVKAHPHQSKFRKRRQRRLKPGRPSHANELWYKSELLRLVRLLRGTTEADLLPLLKQQAQGFGGDAVPMSVAEQIQRTAAKFGNVKQTATRLSRIAVQKNLEATDKQLVDHVKQAVNVDIRAVLTNDGVREAIKAATDANVDLITSIPEEYFGKVAKALSDNWTAGARWEDLSDALSHVGDVTESRAKLIARDQTSKMNGAFNEARQTSIGIEQYQWQTAGDERVRETHAANDGKIFSWDDPPEETGNPGEDINCRCVAIPYFDLDEMENEAGIEGSDD